MKIKNNNLIQSPLTQFDLLKTDETGLSKAFAYIIGKDPKVLYKFLHYLGIKEKNTEKNFRSISIETEKYNKESGRTDIEIYQQGKFHIIIESKIRGNKIKKEQRIKYSEIFKPDIKNILCFITQVNDYQKISNTDTQIENLSWVEISNILDSKEFLDKGKNTLVYDFLKFIKRGYIMRDQKEILVQDLGDLKEIERFRNFQVYRRDVVYGSPLYFAPYFTQKAKQAEGEGIIYLSKVLGILTLNPKNFDSYLDDLSNFCDDAETRNKWELGIRIDKADKDDENVKDFTYFLLDSPLRLKAPLKKDGTKEKGRGKDWIAAMISKNRCVTFHEFIKRMMEAEI